MKENKISYENLHETIENKPLEIETPIREKVEVCCNSVWGFMWLLITGYFFQLIYNTYFIKSKKL